MIWIWGDKTLRIILDWDEIWHAYQNRYEGFIKNVFKRADVEINDHGCHNSSFFRNSEIPNKLAIFYASIQDRFCQIKGEKSSENDCSFSTRSTPIRDRIQRLNQWELFADINERLCLSQLTRHVMSIVRKVVIWDSYFIFWDDDFFLC